MHFGSGCNIYHVSSHEKARQGGGSRGIIKMKLYKNQSRFDLWAAARRHLKLAYPASIRPTLVTLESGYLEYNINGGLNIVCFQEIFDSRHIIWFGTMCKWVERDTTGLISRNMGIIWSTCHTYQDYRFSKETLFPIQCQLSTID